MIPTRSFVNGDEYTAKDYFILAACIAIVLPLAFAFCFFDNLGSKTK